jgi:predicted ATP-dependent endonuclease of OLD family
MLKQLELRNFKSHRHTQFYFDDSRLQAIVGQNSAGKTSVLQSLYYLSCLSNLLDQEDIFSDRFNARLMYGMVAENTTINQASMSIVGDGYDQNAPRTWQFFCGFEQKLNGLWEPRRRWDNGHQKATFVGVETPDSSIVSSRDLQFVTYLKLILTNLSKAEYSEELIPEVQFDGSGLAPTLDYLRSEAPDRFQAIQEMLQQIVPSVKKIGIRRAKVKIDRQRSIEVDGKSIAYDDSQEVTGQEIVLDMNTGDRIPAHAISEGTMLTLGLLTVLMNPKQPNLVLLDDIEQGLHPKAQRELITVFKQIIQANPNLQIIFTTHSPYIIDELQPSQVHVRSNSKAGFTHAKRLDQHPDAEWAKQTLTTGEFWNAEGEDWVVEGDLND